jgi:hypothetical protein
MEVLAPFDLISNKSKLNNLLPEGAYIKDMSAISVQEKSLNSFIMRYEYEIKGGDLFHIDKFLLEKEIHIEREKGTINIRKMVEDARRIDEDTINLVLIDQGEIKVRLGSFSVVL